MYCKKCGRQLEDDAKFCQYCGASMEDIANEQASNNAFDDASEQASNNAYNENASQNASNNENVGSQNFVQKQEQKVGFGESYKLFWKNYFNFSSHASISETLFAFLWNILINAGLIIIIYISILSSAMKIAMVPDNINAFQTIRYVGGFTLFMYILVWVFNIATLIPMISLTIRRLKTCGRSPFWILFDLIPGIGWIIY